MRNLGAYAAPDGRLVFDINDFDETIRAPFEWDLKRMAASLVLAGRESGHKESLSREAVVKCVERYCAQMRTFAKIADAGCDAVPGASAERRGTGARGADEG